MTAAPGSQALAVVRQRHRGAPAARSGVLELRHEGVVTKSVLQLDLGLCHREPARRVGLEEVGVGGRVGEDRRDRDVGPADLRGDVPVHVFGGDDVELALGRRRAATTGKSQHGRRENDNGSHYHCGLE